MLGPGAGLPGGSALVPGQLARAEHAVAVAVEEVEAGGRAGPFPMGQAVVPVAVEVPEEAHVLDRGMDASGTLGFLPCRRSPSDLRPRGSWRLGRVPVALQPVGSEQLGPAQASVLDRPPRAFGSQGPLAGRDVSVLVAVQLLEALQVGVLLRSLLRSRMDHSGDSEGQE